MSGRRILVIDDESAVQDVIRLSLEDFAFEFHAIGHLADLESALRDSRPDLILLDQSMPERSGLDICKDLKADPGSADVPVVLMTVEAFDPPESGGPEAVLLKPFRPVTLLNTIYRCLNLGGGAGA
jgi:two-component system phosphate regulon response regulator PhoB